MIAVVIQTPGRQAVSLNFGDDVADRVLQHEARDTCARVDGGEDEERLEHDREVVPEARQGSAAERTAA